LPIERRDDSYGAGRNVVCSGLQQLNPKRRESFSLASKRSRLAICLMQELSSGGSRSLPRRCSTAVSARTWHFHRRMKSETPTFADPPIVEFVLGVQFDKLKALTSAHYGQFWEHLGDEWESSSATTKRLAISPPTNGRSRTSIASIAGSIENVSATEAIFCRGCSRMAAPDRRFLIYTRNRSPHTMFTRFSRRVVACNSGGAT